jgi:hypothetical protein
MHTRSLAAARTAGLFGLALLTALIPSGPAAAQHLAALQPVTATATSSPSFDDSLIPFLPTAQEVLLQRTSDPQGNVKVMVRLDEEGVNRLKDETGRTDFIIVGLGGDPTLFRDDGQGVDDVTGDLLFTGIGNTDEAELVERSETDITNRDSGTTRSTGVPTFDGRVFAGFEPAEVFDADAFLANQPVKLGDPVETVSGETTEAAQVSSLPGAGELDSIAGAMVTPGINTFQARSLMITDVSVVTDPARTIDPCTGFGNPNGVWTFKHLMTEMANPARTGIDPRTFVEQWLNHWLANQVINTDNVPARAQMNSLISQWHTFSGGANVPLNLDIAPLRLLAIVARTDLATTRGGGSGYGSRTGSFLDAGEARFIFGWVLPPGWSAAGFTFSTPINGTNCRALPFTTILEYRVPKCDCKGVRSWARQWVNLSTLPFPSSTYNAALERITEQFAAADANPIKPNGSAIGQVRTNEIALFPEWQLREFQLNQLPHSFLAETTTADNPISTFNPSPTFDNWVLGPVLNAILIGGPGAAIPGVPLFFGGNPFLGAKAPVPTPGFFWNAAVNFADPNQNDARFRASLATCGACHAGETQTFFTHVEPSTPGLPATLSGFLTGINGVPDPANPAGTPLRDFDDLARRELDIKKKARMACGRFPRIHVSLVKANLKQFGVLPPDPFEGLAPLPPEEQLPIALDALDSKPISEVH